MQRSLRASVWSVSGLGPIAVGSTLYFPTMVGMVYVIDASVAEFGEAALLSVSDLGPAQETWTLSAMAYSDGQLFARTRLVLGGQARRNTAS